MTGTQNPQPHPGVIPWLGQLAHPAEQRKLERQNCLPSLSLLGRAQ